MVGADAGRRGHAAAGGDRDRGSRRSSRRGNRGPPGTPAGAGTTAGAGTGTAATIASGGIEPTAEGTAPELHGHDAGCRPTGDDRDGTDHGPHGTGAARARITATSTVAGSGSSPRRAAAVADGPSCAGTSVGKPIESASRASVAGDYRTMTVGNGDEARRGYYGIAYTLRAQGKPAEALRNLDGYVGRFSKGAELDDVLWMRIKIPCRAQVD